MIEREYYAYHRHHYTTLANAFCYFEIVMVWLWKMCIGPKLGVKFNEPEHRNDCDIIYSTWIDCGLKRKQADYKILHYRQKTDCLCEWKPKISHCKMAKCCVISGFSTRNHRPEIQALAIWRLFYFSVYFALFWTCNCNYECTKWSVYHFYLREPSNTMQPTVYSE